MFPSGAGGTIGGFGVVYSSFYSSWFAVGGSGANTICIAKSLDNGVTWSSVNSALFSVAFHIESYHVSGNIGKRYPELLYIYRNNSKHGEN